MIRRLLTACGVLVATAICAPSGLAQTPQPGAQSANTPAAPQHAHGRGGNRLVLSGAEGAVITLWRPDLQTLPLRVEHGAITLPRTGMDNYHAVVAEKDWGRLRETVIRYEYLRGKPSRRSPDELTQAEKATFEIVPAPLPREHRHFTDGKRWNFLLRFRNRPLADHPVALETGNGSRLETRSLADGRFSFTLPNDFPDTLPGRRDRRSADFQISAEHQTDGVTYQTTLSAEYRVDASHWQSAPMGFGAMGLGFLVGIIFSRGRIGRHRGPNA